MTKRRRSVKHLLLAAGLLVAGGVVIARRSSSSPSTTPGAAAMEADFKAAYPMTAPVNANMVAGVDLGKLAPAGLRLHARDDRAADDGGILLSYADLTGEVRLLVHLVVAQDATTARKMLDQELHGVSMQLPKAVDPSLGDLAWADDFGKGTGYVVATKANLQYSVNVVSPVAGMPTAAAVAAQIHALSVLGTPVFPTVTVTLPPTVDAKLGAPVRVDVPGGQPYKVRADGGYVAHGPVVRPFGPGAVTVMVTVVDDLGRVTVGKAHTTAK